MGSLERHGECVECVGRGACLGTGRFKRASSLHSSMEKACQLREWLVHQAGHGR